MSAGEPRPPASVDVDAWSSNEEENTGIRALNASLGYRPTVGEIRVRREPGA